MNYVCFQLKELTRQIHANLQTIIKQCIVSMNANAVLVILSQRNVMQRGQRLANRKDTMLRNNLY